MEAIRNSISGVQNLVLGTSSSETEPPSGEKGAGTVDEPYDKGNAPEAEANKADAEAKTESKPSEPQTSSLDTKASGKASETPASPTSPTSTTSATTSPLSKVTSKPGTPYDIIGYRRSSKAQGSSSAPSTSTGPSDATPASSTSTKPAPIQEKAEPPSSTPSKPAATSSAQSTANSTVKAAVGAVTGAATGATAAGAAGAANTNSTSTSAGKEPEKPAPQQDRGRPAEKEKLSRTDYRDISPGEMPDGSHAVTSGDRGESYTPGGGLNKLKGLFQK